MKPEGESRKDLFKRRTKAFASAIVRFYCELPKSRTEVQVLGKQMLRSGTSVAANYREAARSRSHAEFIAKTEQCAQEADETVLWLELLKEDCGVRSNTLDFLLNESDELISIFVTMAKRAKQNLKLET